MGNRSHPLHAARMCAIKRFESNWNTLGVVARDGFQQHYPLLTIPLDNIYLNPKLDLT